MGGKIGNGNKLNFPFFCLPVPSRCTCYNVKRSLLQYMEDIFELLLGSLREHFSPPRPLAINVDGDAARARRKIFSNMHTPNID